MPDRRRATDKQKQLAEDLSVAHRIQLSLLPEFCPDVPGWDLCTEYQAAREVSGDFYDFLEFADASDQLGLVIADVTDKGIPAALFMVMSRTILRATAYGGVGPAQALMRANNLIAHSSRTDLFLTAFYGVLNTRTGQMAYANAGHNPPIWYQRSTGQCHDLTARGTVLAAFEDVELEERTISLAAGDIVAFYTDGITEAMNAAREEFGSDRLKSVIQTCSGQDASAIIAAIVDAVKAFRGDAPQSDDLTCFVIKCQADLALPA